MPACRRGGHPGRARRASCVARFAVASARRRLLSGSLLSAARVVGTTEVTGHIGGAARPRLVPRHDRELVSQGDQLRTPHPAVLGGAVHIDQRRTLPDAFVGDLQPAGLDDIHGRKLPAVGPDHRPSAAAAPGAGINSGGRGRSHETNRASASRSGTTHSNRLAGALRLPGSECRFARRGALSASGPALSQMPRCDSDAARASSDRARTSCLCTGCNGSGRVGLPLVVLGRRAHVDHGHARNAGNSRSGKPENPPRRRGAETSLGQISAARPTRCRPDR